MSEHDPLLLATAVEVAIEARENEANDIQPSKPTSTPWLQVWILILIQLAEPITASVIFPFINQLIQQTGITNGDEKRTGYYAGIVESVFFVMEALTAVAWGRTADWYGRRPVLLVGLVILTVATCGFGLTHMYWWIMISRALQGACNGNIGVTKSVMAEVSDPGTIARVYGLIPVMWSFGVTAGPIIGGLFAEPATRWPNIFGKLRIFRQYPYFLPCAITSVYVALVFLAAFLFLKESLPSAAQSKKKPLSGRDEERRDYGTVSDSSSEAETIHESVPIRALFTPSAIIVLVNYGILAFIDQAIAVLIPLFWSTSLETGGLGMSAHQIGTILGIFGFINGFIQLGLFPPIISKLGARWVFIIGCIALMSNASFLIAAKYFIACQGVVDHLVMTCIVLQLASSSFVYMAYGSILMLFIDVAPPGGLGTMNGLAQAITTAGKAFAPTFAMTLFSVGLERQLLGGAFVFVVLWVLAFVGVVVGFALPKKSK